MDNLCSGIIDLGSGLCNEFCSYFAVAGRSGLSALRWFSMQLNVLNELRQSIGGVTTLAVDEPTLQLNDLELKALSGVLTLLRTDRGLLASLTARASMRERCARCLAESDCHIDIQFEEEFIPVVDANTGARFRDGATDDTFRITPNFVLDLREALWQYMLIAEPLKPLCRLECAGLCPSCGANLNEGACGCAPGVSECWSALAGLRLNKVKGI